MNINMTTDEFHELIMVYIIQLSKTTKGSLDDKETLVYTPEFDDFLRHIQSKPLGNMKHVYLREDQKTKLNYKRMVRAIDRADKVRLTI
jgi:hypothetical protein